MRKACAYPLNEPYPTILARHIDRSRGGKRPAAVEGQKSGQFKDVEFAGVGEPNTSAALTSGVLTVSDDDAVVVDTIDFVVCRIQEFMPNQFERPMQWRQGSFSPPLGDHAVGRTESVDPGRLAGQSRQHVAMRHCGVVPLYFASMDLAGVRPLRIWPLVARASSSLPGYVGKLLVDLGSSIFRNRQPRSTTGYILGNFTNAHRLSLFVNDDPAACLGAGQGG